MGFLQNRLIRNTKKKINKAHKKVTEDNKRILNVETLFHELEADLEVMNKQYQLAVQIVDIYNEFFKEKNLDKEFMTYLSERIGGEAINGK